LRIVLIETDWRFGFEHSRKPRYSGANGTS
jgi:hypothetical protein